MIIEFQLIAGPLVVYKISIPRKRTAFRILNSICLLWCLSSTETASRISSTCPEIDVDGLANLSQDWRWVLALCMLSEISRSIIPVSVTIFEECRFILWRGHFVLFVRLHTCKAQCRISFRIIVQPPEFSKPFWLEWSHSPWLLSFRICIGCRWLINRVQK